MEYKWKYQTPDDFSDMIMTSDGQYLTGLWFEGSRDTLKHQGDFIETKLPIFVKTIEWLDLYFNGKIPDFTPSYKIENSTPFRDLVIEKMNQIPYGKVVTYNDIAKLIAKERKIKQMSAQAVGGAVGWNPICLIIPCHRVVGTNGSLTGYGGGINNKFNLLKLEKVDTNKLTIPKNGAAL
mgnify:FL=1